MPFSIRSIDERRNIISSDIGFTIHGLRRLGSRYHVARITRNTLRPRYPGAKNRSNLEPINSIFRVRGIRAISAPRVGNRRRRLSVRSPIGSFTRRVLSVFSIRTVERKKSPDTILVNFSPFFDSTFRTRENVAARTRNEPNEYRSRLYVYTYSCSERTRREKSIVGDVWRTSREVLDSSRVRTTRILCSSDKG